MTSEGRHGMTVFVAAVVTLCVAASDVVCRCQSTTEFFLEVIILFIFITTFGQLCYEIICQLSREIKK